MQNEFYCWPPKWLELGVLHGLLERHEGGGYSLRYGYDIKVIGEFAEAIYELGRQDEAAA